MATVKTVENHLQFNQLSAFPKLKHAIFLADVDAKEQKGLERIEQTLGLPVPYQLKQVHGVKVVEITSTNPLGEIEGDALITKELSKPLMIKHADCQAAIFYDPTLHVLGMAHAGWRGTKEKIYTHVIQAMREAFGSEPCDLRVAISPSLGPKHAEFIHYKEELPPSFWAYKDDQNRFDFWEIAKDELIREGILLKHLEIARLCTYEDSSRFFSYRRDKTLCRHATVAMLL